MHNSIVPIISTSSLSYKKNRRHTLQVCCTMMSQHKANRHTTITHEQMQYMYPPLHPPPHIPRTEFSCCFVKSTSALRVSAAAVKEAFSSDSCKVVEVEWRVIPVEGHSSGGWVIQGHSHLTTHYTSLYFASMFSCVIIFK